ncbi:MAG TPA: hypothetical protein VGD74_10690 [Vulgatibacter sp.]
MLDDAMVGVAPHLSNAIGGVRLQVDSADRKDAGAVLSAPHVVPEPVLRDEFVDDPPPLKAPLTDRLARRAFVAAILGVTVVPLIGTAISADALLSYVRQSRQEGEVASTRGRVLAGLALALDLVAALAASAMFIRRFA